MPDSNRVFLAAALAFALEALLSASALAQMPKGGTSRIICWTDASGKVVGCGDKVPPEYEGAATRELDRRGVTRKTTDTAEVEAKRAAEKEAMAKQKAEENRRYAEQRRRDLALLNTYAHEDEIDRRRDRELQEADRVLKQFEELRKSAMARRDTARERVAAAAKAEKPSDFLQDEVARAEADMERHEMSIAAKNREKEEIRARYAETRQRYMTLKAAGPRPAGPTSKK
ncbi:MAG TPA: hypothetical protein VIA19_03750 [Burkholderiales bacterium]|jgi:hypothetical protein